MHSKWNQIILVKSPTRLNYKRNKNENGSNGKSIRCESDEGVVAAVQEGPVLEHREQSGRTGYERAAHRTDY